MSDGIFREHSHHPVSPTTVATMLVTLCFAVFGVGIWAFFHGVEQRRTPERAPIVWPESSTDALRRRIDDLERRVSRAEGQLERIPVAPP